MPGIRGASAPFFSPDGLWVGFLATNKLKKTAVDGGSPVVLCDAINILGATWGEDGGIIAVLGTGLARIPESGGAPTVVLDLTKESASAGWPQILPGRKLVLFTRSSSSGRDIEALDLVTGKRRVLVRGSTFGRYLPNGYLVYINQGTLFAVPWGPDQTEVRGAPTAVLSGVSYSANFGYADLDFSRTGVLVYGKGGGGEVIPRWLESGGNTVELAIPPATYRWPHLSPDGKRLALSVSESGECGTAIFDLDSNRITRVPSAGLCYPMWNPDGRSLFSAGRGGLYWFPADSSGSPKPLTRGNTIQVPWSLTPNGDRLAYYQMSSSNGFDLWTIPIRASAGAFTAGTPELFLGTPAFETYPFSPDGRWMAYDSNDSGTFEIYVRAFPDNGTRVQVSTAGGIITRWSPNGRELFYRTDDQRIMVAAYTIRAGSFVVGSVRQWSPARLADTGVIANFDLSPDGHRILGLMPAAKPEEQQAENHVTFVLNFFDEVRRRVSVGK